MKHLKNLFIDGILEFVEGWDRLGNIFRKKNKISLLAANIDWCTNSGWMDRLVAYRQLELWTFDK